MTEPAVNTSPKTWDEVKTTTCYMCACRCGIRVHLKDGRVTYIDGNPDHPVNKGVICGKGAAGIMQHYSPARLSKPLMRVGERGSGEFREIEWEEALSHRRRLALGGARQGPEEARLLHRPRPEPGPHRLVGRAIRHAQLCRPWRLLLRQHGGGGPLHLRRLLLGIRRAGLEAHQILHALRRRRGPCLEPDQEGAGPAQGQRGAKIVSINPIRTGYSAIADEWIGIRPGTDGLFVGALIHELLDSQKIDGEYLLRYTNSPWLIIENPGGAR